MTPTQGLSRQAGTEAFDDLPVVDGLDLHHAWDVFGRDDQLGSLNRLTSENVMEAAHAVRTGVVTNLVVPLGAIDPPLYGREPLKHEIFAPDRNSLDDRLDAFYLQGSSQWDGLRHVRAREFGFWGGRTDAAAFAPGSGPLGVEHWVEKGFVGRGVLLDVERYLSRAGEDYDPGVERSISGTLLEEIAESQGTPLRTGDILCIRFGWMGAYLEAQADGHDTTPLTTRFAGLSADEEMSRWLWNGGVAAIAADNPSIEVSPGDPAVGSFHRRNLPLLGLALGELFTFDRLAEQCQEDQRWDFLFVSVPLLVVGGVGSPANAIAIR